MRCAFGIGPMQGRMMVDPAIIHSSVVLSQNNVVRFGPAGAANNSCAEVACSVSASARGLLTWWWPGPCLHILSSQRLLLREHMPTRVMRLPQVFKLRTDRMAFDMVNTFNHRAQRVVRLLTWVARPADAANTWEVRYENGARAAVARDISGAEALVDGPRKNDSTFVARPRDNATPLVSNAGKP